MFEILLLFFPFIDDETEAEKEQVTFKFKRIFRQPGFQKKARYD